MRTRTRFWSVCRSTRGHHRIERLEVGDAVVVGVLSFKNERDGYLGELIRAPRGKTSRER